MQDAFVHCRHEVGMHNILSAAMRSAEREMIGKQGCFKHGRKLATRDPREKKFEHRLSSGWAAFFKFKGALCDKCLPLKDWVRLLEATVTPCILYACGTWTMTAEMERKLRSTKRRVLRKMVKVTRKHEEDWPEFVKRATHISEEQALQQLQEIHERYLIVQNMQKQAYSESIISQIEQLTALLQEMSTSRQEAQL